MKKKVSQLVKGDVIRVEYGDDDNWVTVVVDEVNKVSQEKKYNCTMNCKFYHEPCTEVVMYGTASEYAEVLKNIYDEK